jgi:hypothetical protein
MRFAQERPRFDHEGAIRPSVGRFVHYSNKVMKCSEYSLLKYWSPSDGARLICSFAQITSSDFALELSDNGQFLTFVMLVCQIVCCPSLLNVSRTMNKHLVSCTSTTMVLGDNIETLIMTLLLLLEET